MACDTSPPMGVLGLALIQRYSTAPWKPSPKCLGSLCSCDQHQCLDVDECVEVWFPHRGIIHFNTLGQTHIMTVFILCCYGTENVLVPTKYLSIKIISNFMLFFLRSQILHICSLFERKPLLTHSLSYNGGPKETQNYPLEGRPL